MDKKRGREALILCWFLLVIVHLSDLHETIYPSRARFNALFKRMPMRLAIRPANATTNRPVPARRAASPIAIGLALGLGA